MSKKRKEPKRLEPHKEKTSLSQKWLWLKLQAGRFFWDYHGLQDDIGHWVVAHEKKIKKWLIIAAVIVIITVILCWVGGAFLESVTVYRNGVPVLGPGAESSP